MVGSVPLSPVAHWRFIMVVPALRQGRCGGYLTPARLKITSFHLARA